MTIGRCLVVAAIAGCGLLGAAPTSLAIAPGWMTEAAVRTAFIGKTLDGHYRNGITWTESYRADGRLDYRQGLRQAAGTWHFRDGTVFCTFYDPPHRPTLAGGCWITIQTSANCYEFHLAGTAANDPEEGEPGRWLPHWNARAWRQEAPSTCQEKPSV